MLGLNGAGKSTLFSLITRLYESQHGRIRIFGHDIAPCARARRCGCSAWCSSPARSISTSAVTQNLLYHAALHGIGSARHACASDEVLARLGLADRAGSKVRDLSGGQMRRIEIARALLHRPRLLLLDEATVGLDVKARADILDHVRQLVTEQGIGVLWATHLFDEVAAGDDRRGPASGPGARAGPVADVVADAGANDMRRRLHAPDRRRSGDPERRAMSSTTARPAGAASRSPQYSPA